MEKTYMLLYRAVGKNSYYYDVIKIGNLEKLQKILKEEKEDIKNVIKINKEDNEEAHFEILKEDNFSFKYLNKIDESEVIFKIVDFDKILE